MCVIIFIILAIQWLIQGNPLAIKLDFQNLIPKCLRQFISFLLLFYLKLTFLDGDDDSFFSNCKLLALPICFILKGLKGLDKPTELA